MSTEMNIPELEAIAAMLDEMEDGRQFDMRFFATKNECGTTACIAGWVLLQSGYTLDERNHFHNSNNDIVYSESNEAAKILGLSSHQEDLLFYERYWPQKFRVTIVNGIADKIIYNDPKVAAARIRHFIATEGRE